MKHTLLSRAAAGIAAALTLTIAVAAPASAHPASHPPQIDHSLPGGTRFYVDPGSEAAVQAVTDLRHHNVPDALAMSKLASYPEASWFTKGTPDQVRAAVAKVERGAAQQDAVATLVAYNIPGRDCSQYSAGGAADSSAYRAWITAFAKGIGDRRTVVILEPDALANLPSDCGQDPDGTNTPARLADINFAVTALEAQPKTLVYLDAGHSTWHSTGDMTTRLIAAGVDRAQGFFLNVSNFQPTAQLNEFGTWISKCIAYLERQGGAAGDCASEYFPATVGDPTTWGLSDAWYDTHVHVAPTTHFVVDTSRNGQGAWTPAAGINYSDPQAWCNPPNRGIGIRPTANSKVALVDAYLWVKTIGESDGTCTRGTAGPADPVHGSVDPIAGGWWPSQALSLVENASPALQWAWRS